jgi:exodeoxyribonuclease V gamma subunit
MQQTGTASRKNGLTVHTGNRLGALAEELARVIESPLSSPFEPETIVVQSLGMRRWLSLQIAELRGICMNCNFPFIRNFLDEVLCVVSPDMDLAEEFLPELMTWKLHALLPAQLRKKIFAPVSRYLADDDGLKLFQLAEKIACLFDQYLVFRPDMICRWERDTKGLRGDEAWQAALWNELHEGRMHIAAVRELIAGRMASAPPDAPLPERVLFFGISAISPLHLELIFHLASIREVHLFLVQPSSEYHGADLTPKQRARRGMASIEETPAGNPLLTSLGRLNAHFTETLLDTDERLGHRIKDGAQCFTEPHGESVLHTLQRDILRAQNRGEIFSLADEEELAPKLSVPPTDRSIQIHACHSPMREVEILYDNLLDLFQNDPALRPRDILVMSPEIEKYAPFVHAVFGYPEDETRRIPFSVSDRLPRSENPAVDAFLALLELPGTRCIAREIFALLETPAMRQRFGFDDDELSLIRRWMQETGICWGMDGAHRMQFDLPVFEANTWQQGLDRLLLGYAMAGGNRAMFEGILPFDEIEGSNAEILGRFISAVSAIAEWGKILVSAMNQFFAQDDQQTARDLRALRDGLQRLARIAESATQSVDFTIVRYHLNTLLSEPEQRGNFLTGGVTFCALKPVRSIPARVIFLLGMNENVFPRRAQPLPFDLMARERALGDPSVRDDDRYTFLEAMLSAEDRLCISFVGRSIADNEEIPPSIVVSELLDYLDQSCALPEEKNAREFFVTEHRLQAFSPRYFDGDRCLFSYSEANAAASRSRHPAQASAPRFFPVTLAERTENMRIVELGMLMDFFSNPARHLLRYRLSIRLDENDTCLAETEPMELDGRKRYDIKQELLGERLGMGTAANPKMFSARGVLAPGELGTRQFRSLHREAEIFHAKLRAHIGDGAREEPLLLNLRLGDCALSGRIESLYSGKVVQFRCAKLKPRDWLQAWIPLLACRAAEPHMPRAALLLGTDEEVIFEPPNEAEILLAQLLKIYAQGLAQPLPFCPASALAFARAKFNSTEKSKTSPLEKARAAWHGGWKIKGEKEDAHMAFCFGDREPFCEEFETLAEQVFKPMFDHIRR